ncbi:MAG TPA: hypothetical protein VK936_02570 [Longimicrobiales bacterium]|nr:hypothetical protein [Longimicrobiales bacterium]
MTRIATLFFEDYWLVLAELIRQMHDVAGSVTFAGPSARRRTVCARVDALRAEGIDIAASPWIGDLEREWVAGEFDPAVLAMYADRYGEDTVKRLLICDRELAFGYVSGGQYASTPLRRLVEAEPDRRWQYVCGALRYHERLFADFRPDLVFVPELTTTYELAAYHVARRFGVPCHTLAYSRFGSRVLLVDHPSGRTPDIDSLAVRARMERGLIGEEVWARAAAAFGNLRSVAGAPEYSRLIRDRAYDMTRWRGFARSMGLAVAKGAAGRLGLGGTRGFLRTRPGTDLVREAVRRFAVSRRAFSGRWFADPRAMQDRPYFYFPLHVEPEASMMVLAPHATNQLALIEDVSKAMPPGFRLLVKEHIPMLGGRPPGFYERIRAMPDVVLVDPLADNHVLIRDAALVVTVTGTAGWEAIVHHRPVLVFGESQYLGLEAGYHVASRRPLHDDIAAAMAVPPVPDEALLAYIAATLVHSFDIPHSTWGYAHYGHDAEAAVAASRPEIRRLAADLLERAAASRGIPAA